MCFFHYLELVPVVDIVVAPVRPSYHGTIEDLKKDMLANAVDGGVG